MLWTIGNEAHSDFGLLAASLDPWVGYGDKVVAAKLNIKCKLWENSKRLLEKSHHGERPLIVVLDDNVIGSPHWSKYQKEYDRQKKYRNPKMRELQQIIQSKVADVITAKGYTPELQPKVTAKVTGRIENREERIEIYKGNKAAIVDNFVDNFVDNSEPDIEELLHDIAEVIGSRQVACFRAYYKAAASELTIPVIRRLLAETKAAAHEGRIEKTVGAFFAGLINREIAGKEVCEHGDVEQT